MLYYARRIIRKYTIEIWYCTRSKYGMHKSREKAIINKRIIVNYQGFL